MKRIEKKINGKLISVLNRGAALRETLGSRLKKDRGLDGVVVVIGLMIIALLIMLVMKDSLSTFVTSLTSSMQQKAQTILSGN